MATQNIAREHDRLKWAFFALMGVCTIMAVYADDRFLFNSSDPHWKHIAPVKWLLLAHGLCGGTALVTGVFQFSSTLRTARPALHRWTGRAYLSAVCIAAPLAIYIGTGSLEPNTIHVEQWFQGGLWWLCAAVALVCILNGKVMLHKEWMMRSYAFTLIFVLARVPDLFFKVDDEALGNLLWGLVVTALFMPDLVLTIDAFRLERSRARAAGKRATTSDRRPQAPPNLDAHAPSA